MRTRAAAKWFGGIAATLVVTMVASVAPATAAKSNDADKDAKGGKGGVVSQRWDTGWG